MAVAAPNAPSRKGRAATPAPLSGATDTSEKAAEHVPAAAPAVLPSGAAAGVELASEAETAVQAAQAAIADAVANGIVADSADVQLGHVVEVTAHVSRRRAGRAWSAGEVVSFVAGELDFDQWTQLEDDPGFTVVLKGLEHIDA